MATDILKPKGTVHVQIIRDGKIIKDFKCNNGITTVGKNKHLDVMFHGDTQVTTWYIGLVDNASFSAFSAADTMSSHAGWIENQDYDEATRVEWTEGAASAGSITNGTAITFTMSATVTIHGIFVTSVSTKGGTTGTLWSTAAFSADASVIDNDLIKVTYTVSE